MDNIIDFEKSVYESEEARVEEAYEKERSQRNEDFQSLLNQMNEANFEDFKALMINAMGKTQSLISEYIDCILGIAGECGTLNNRVKTLEETVIANQVFIMSHITDEIMGKEKLEALCASLNIDPSDESIHFLTACSGMATGAIKPGADAH